MNFAQFSVRRNCFGLAPSSNSVLDAALSLESQDLAA